MWDSSVCGLDESSKIGMALRELELMNFDELTAVRAEDVNTVAFGLAQYAKAHFGGLVPVSAEQPMKVARQVKEATNLDIPPIYAAALAAGSNWWVTPEYMGSRGHRVTTAEADMMIEKTYLFYGKHMAATQLDLSAERDAVVAKMQNAKQEHEQMHLTKPLHEIPKYARNVERWLAYLKMLGRSLPFDDAWDVEWFDFQKHGFHTNMQLRKLKSGCVFLSHPLQSSPAIAGLGLRGDKRGRQVRRGQVDIECAAARDHGHPWV